MDNIKGATRPMNISNMMMILPSGVKSGVTPVLNPTVPNADTASNTTPSQFCEVCTEAAPDSVNISKPTPTMIVAIPSKAIMTAMLAK